MTAPSRVRNATATIDYANGENIVTVSWLPPANRGSLPITSYAVQYSVGGQSWGAIESIPYNYTGLPTNANSRSITHTLKTGIPFLYKPTFYRIAAITGTNRFASPWVTVGPVYAITQTPATPTIHQFVSTGDDSGLLTIAKPILPGTSPITGYILLYKFSGSSEPWSFLNLPYYGDHTTVPLSGLSVGAYYDLSVGARNSSGVGIYSDPIRIKTTNPAAVPTLLNGIPSHGPRQTLACGGSDDMGWACIEGNPRALRVFWYDNHRGPLAISSWTIQIRRNNTPPLVTLNIPNSSVKTLPQDNRIRYVDIFQGVGSVAQYKIEDRVYQVQVRGQTAEGTLGFSELKAFSAAWTPSAPVINNVTRVGTTANISVTQPVHLGYIGTDRFIYDIQYKPASVATWSQIRQVLTPRPQNPVHQLSVGGLNPSLVWQFRVSFVGHVVDFNGRAIQNGPYSNIFTA